MTTPCPEAENLLEARHAIEAVWAEMRHNPWVLRTLGEPILRLPDISESAIRARSGRGGALRNRIDAIEPAGLPHDLTLTLASARLAAARWAQEADWYWLVFDPLGIGFFGLFGATAYCGGWLLNTASGMLAMHSFASAGDVHRYLGLLDDYAGLLDAMFDRTAGQAERGIRMPRLQIDQSIELLRGLRGAAPAALLPKAERLGAVSAKTACKSMADLIDARVRPAFDALIALLDDPTYRSAAPEAVGMAQYPDGRATYDALVRLHTTLDTTPEAVHAQGLARVEAINVRLELLAARLGCIDRFALHAKIESDPAWRARGDAGLIAVFERYIERIAPHIDSWFNFKPIAGYGAAPLPEALAGSMTFGFYDPPGPDKPIGRYLFNTRNLEGSSTASLATLTYHELVPGHHMHVASQVENKALHPVRAHSFVNAFNEGWAEYAATLAGEMGMYVAPEEEFGRLAMDVFLTCRLVLDTGMNALGWTLGQARDYMRANTFYLEAEVASETLRYSCDIPGQSLAYKLGEYFLMDLREGMRAALGARFDMRAFHDVVLRTGTLPLPLVADNVERATRAALVDG